VDEGQWQLPPPSMNRFNETELATFSFFSVPWGFRFCSNFEEKKPTTNTLDMLWGTVQTDTLDMLWGTV
jgi:hypothetical protein